MLNQLIQEIFRTECQIDHNDFESMIVGRSEDLRFAEETGVPWTKGNEAGFFISNGRAHKKLMGARVIVISVIACSRLKLNGRYDHEALQNSFDCAPAVAMQGGGASVNPMDDIMSGRFDF